MQISFHYLGMIIAINWQIKAIKMPGRLTGLKGFTVFGLLCLFVFGLLCYPFSDVVVKIGRAHV